MKPKGDICNLGCDVLALTPVVFLDDTEDNKLCTSAAFKSK